MLKTIPIKCASCGANLDITPDVENFSCGYCGAAQIILRQGGTISLKLVGDAIKRVQVGTDKTAAELAIKRLSGELEGVQQAVNDNAYMKQVRLQKSTKNFVLIWGGILFFIISFASNAKSALGFFSIFIILIFTSTACVGYFYFQKRRVIADEFDEKYEVLAKRWQDLQQKLRKNKQLVD